MISKETKLQALQQMVAKGKINQHLFKYRAIGKFTDAIFNEHTLWFSHPNEFNDPFDCWANIQSVDQIGLNDLVQRNALIKQERDICKKGIDFFTPEMLKEDVDKVMNRLGICCFCKNERQILMWSNYSDYHKGICLQFDIFEDPDFFTTALPVNYVEKMPTYDHFNERNKILEKIIQPKSQNEWGYEEEIRIVKTDRDISLNGNSQAFKFNPTSLRKVIFGCKASDDTIDKYMKLCNKDNHLEHVTFSKMEQKTDGLFELEELPL